MPSSSPAEWDDVVRSTTAATPFHLWDFLDAYATASRLHLVCLLARSGGRTVGAVPLLERRRGPLRWVNQGLPFCYAGPVVRADGGAGSSADGSAGDSADGSADGSAGDGARGADDERDLLAAVLQQVARRAPLVTVRARLEVRADPHALRTGDGPLGGWRARAGTAMVVPLAGRTDDDLRAAASKKFRQHLGHAARGGLTLGPASDHDVDVLLPAWVSERFTAQGLAPAFPAELVRRVHASFAARGAVQAHAASVDGETVGVQLSLVLGGRSYAWMIGGAAGHERLRVPTALSWHLLASSRAAGLSEVDLSGAPTEGIRGFKRAMGAREHPYTVLERGRSG